jgi:hypothetical protein
MVVQNMFGSAQDRKFISFLEETIGNQRRNLAEYVKSYNRKLQMIKAFEHTWDENEITRLREEIEKIMKIDVSEKAYVAKGESSVKEIIDQINKRLSEIINSTNSKLEINLLDETKKLLAKLEILGKNLELQEKWFQENTTYELVNENKELLMNLIRREGGVLFGLYGATLDKLDDYVHEIIASTSNIVIQTDTYEACHAELLNELGVFDKDEVDFSIETIKKLGGGFKNPVLLVKVSEECSLVAKGFAEAGAYQEMKTARKFIIAAGGLVPDIVRVSDNEIVSSLCKGNAIRKILVEKSQNCYLAFYTLGKSLATIHNNSIQSLSFYDPRILFQKGYSKDYGRLKEHMKELKKYGLVNSKEYNTFLNLRKKYKSKKLCIIHGDAHLDNFFYVENPASIMIVDYDDSKPGDPVADVGRVISSIRNWQFKAGLDELYVEEVINWFMKGYNSVLNIDLGGTNLYMVRLYMIVIKSSGKLFEKVVEKIKKDKVFRERYGPNLRDLFTKNLSQVGDPFSVKEIEKLREVQFCLQEIQNFIYGKKVNVLEMIMKKIGKAA